MCNKKAFVIPKNLIFRYLIFQYFNSTCSIITGASLQHQVTTKNLHYLATVLIEYLNIFEKL